MLQLLFHYFSCKKKDLETAHINKVINRFRYIIGLIICLHLDVFNLT